MVVRIRRDMTAGHYSQSPAGADRSGSSGQLSLIEETYHRDSGTNTNHNDLPGEPTKSGSRTGGESGFELVEILELFATIQN